ncbi:MAG: PQQ-binding-like beta-propeller repeat protein [Actinomycetota bacterium]|nr:PQQ-binding-like beta-propeller repeat protein [Actinomycetota bacterium]
MRWRKARSLVVLSVLLALSLSSCKVDWATWGFGGERQSFNPWEETIGSSNVSRLRQQWSVDLGAYINASPIEATGVEVGRQAIDVVYVGTEHGVLFAISTGGKILWHRELGRRFADCPDTPDKIYGVSGSAVFDRASNRVYAAGGDGRVYALDAGTGAVVPGWPVRITADPAHEFVYGALTLSGRNLYVGVASRCDVQPYHGRLVRIDAETRRTNAFYVSGSAHGPDGGGIWGWGGASVDPDDGNVYVATGNTIAEPQNLFYGDHVVQLDAVLHVLASHSPATGIEDDDFGSTPTLFQKPGCPAQLVTEQKNGSLYLYDRDAIASGYRQKLTLLSGGSLIGVAAYSPDTEMVYVAHPRAFGDMAQGLLAFRLDAACKLRLAWQAKSPVGIGPTPTVANGVVYYSDGFTPKLHAVDARTGTQLWTSGSDLTPPVLATPIVINGQVLAGSYDHDLHAWALP